MKMRFTCVGDMLVQRRIPAGYPGFEEVRDQICKGYARLFNLETTLHNESIPYAAEEAYALQGLTSDATMRELFYDRTAGYTRGLIRDHRMVESMIPYFEMEDGKLTYLELMPIELNFGEPSWRAGNPRFSRDHGIIERLAEMSQPFGTEITIDQRGYGIVKL